MIQQNKPVSRQQAELCTENNGLETFAAAICESIVLDISFYSRSVNGYMSQPF